MKRFIVIQERPVTAVWTYEVEAETEEQALEQVRNGDVTPEEMNMEDNWDWDEDNSTYEVYEQ